MYLNLFIGRIFALSRVTVGGKLDRAFTPSELCSFPPSPLRHSLAIRSVVKPSMLYNPFWVIFPLKEISANYTGCPTGVEF